MKNSKTAKQINSRAAKPQNNQTENSKTVKQTAGVCLIGGNHAEKNRNYWSDGNRSGSFEG